MVFIKKPFPFYNVFVHNTKQFGRKIRKQVYKRVSVVEENSYVTKTVSFYNLYDFDDWLRNLLKNFTLKYKIWLASCY